MSDPPREARGEPLDPRLVTFLHRTTVAAFLIALAAQLPDPAGDVAGWTAAAVVIAAPLVRVAWLAASWLHRDDVRFAAAAVGLLAIVGAGSLAAALTT